MSDYSNSTYASDFEDEEPRRWTGDHRTVDGSTRMV